MASLPANIPVEIEMVVEVDDPTVSVSVEGTDVVITGAGAKEIRLKPGDYQVKASNDGKVVQQELVTVQLDGRRVVKISKESALAAKPAASREETERWEKSVAAMPAAEQLKAVADRLKQLNPGFDGEIIHQMNGEQVIGLAVVDRERQVVDGEHSRAEPLRETDDLDDGFGHRPPWGRTERGESTAASVAWGPHGTDARPPTARRATPPRVPGRDPAAVEPPPGHRRVCTVRRPRRPRLGRAMDLGLHVRPYRRGLDSR